MNPLHILKTLYEDTLETRMPRKLAHQIRSLRAFKQRRECWGSLRAFEAECRRRRPIPRADQLTAEEEAERRALGFVLLKEFLEQWGYWDLARYWVGEEHAPRGSSLVAVISSMPGLVAMSEIRPELDENRDYRGRLILLLPEEWKAWRRNRTESDFRFLFRVWCTIHRLEFREDDLVCDSDFAEAARSNGIAYVKENYPADDISQYRVITSGRQIYPEVGSERAHLFKWNAESQKLDLVEQEFLYSNECY